MTEITYTNIVGDYFGWRNDAIYMLRDGSCWRPKPGEETNLLKANPMAALFTTKEGHFLQVAGGSKRQVERADVYENGRWWNEFVNFDREAAAALFNLIQSPTYRDVMAEKTDDTV